MSLAEYYHQIATGPKRQRELLTPVGLLVFGGTLAIVIVGGLGTDRVLRLPGLLGAPVGLAVGGPIFLAGVFLCGWCVARFWKARGTPVPMNPPTELVTSGAYALVRNPMVTGIFGALFGLGLMLDSIGIALIWTPAYVLLHLIELKRVEEPELERRFGSSYAEYKKRVPMFIPRLRRLRKRDLPSGM